MVEIRRGTGISGAGGGTLSERLPWLEPVEDEDDDGRGGGHGDPGDGPDGYGGVVLAGIAVLVAIALVTAGIVWFRHHRAATADIGEVIHPEPGPYKVKPPNPGGLDTQSVGAVAAGTSAGEDIDSVLDLNAVPETPMATRAARPVAGRQSPAAPRVPPPPSDPLPASAPVRQAGAAPPKPPAAAPVAVAEATAPPLPEGAGAGGSIQLGAFSTEPKAKAAWKGLSSRFAFLKEMIPVVSAVDAGGTRLFRLRASGGPMPAARLCAQLKVAGETCAVVGG